MDADKIVKMLQECRLNDLLAVQEALVGLVQKAKARRGTLSENESRQLREEDRFQTDTLATAVRITDVRPGERKEFSAVIKDLSRNGMCLRIDNSFIPSRIIEVTFASPGGKIKCCVMEVVRLRKMADQDGSWLEVGCRTASNERVRRLRLQEEQVNKMRGKLRCKKNILVVVVGRNTDETNKVVQRIETEGYKVRHLEVVAAAMNTIQNLSAQLVIFCEGSQLCRDKQQLAMLLDSPAKLAKLAIIKDTEDRFALAEAGIDECLMAHQDEYLFTAMERALVGHLVRQNRKSETSTSQALVITLDNTVTNLISYQLQEHGYEWQVAQDAEDARKISDQDFDLIFADFNPQELDVFKAIQDDFGKIPIIALCDEISQGHQAMKAGASNYLCMPPKEDDMRMILQSLLTCTESLA